MRIDLAADAHLPDHYLSDQGLRLEAYRRLASSFTHSEVEEVVAGWEDRYGPVPPEARALAQVAALRVECLRVGVDEVMGIRDEVRLSGVSLRESQRVRAQRLAPGAFYQPDAGLLFIPAPRPGPGWTVGIHPRNVAAAPRGGTTEGFSRGYTI